MQIANTVPQSASEGAAHASASPQLVKAANAFEANFLGELLKPLREDPLFGNGSGLGGDSLGSEGGGGGSMATVASLASDALAQAIAKQGGLGIARMVLAELSPVERTESQTAAAAMFAGPKCGDCAPPLTMGPEAAGGLDSGSVEMLGQGSLVAAPNGTEKNATDKLARGASSAERWRELSPAKAVRAVWPIRK